MFEQATWLNPPQQWTRSDDRLTVTTDAHTDFWRETHYGFTRDNGHFFCVQTAGDFTAQMKIEASFEQLYDQAGLMVRVDEAHWVKIGAELSDGTTLLSSVLTDEVSDWATGTFPGDPQAFWIRATVTKGVLRVQVSVDGVHWPLVRLAPFKVAASYQVGPYCCTPERGGLEVSFSE
ncbi:DUF1349 domain-containing protein [Pseudomonas sp. AMR01]|uniref:DUF1349 domain-containing protein n=1 Tax=Pseudomonas sp. AMR01 TaxID=3064904 RepID=UPI0035C063A9